MLSWPTGEFTKRGISWTMSMLMPRANRGHDLQLHDVSLSADLFSSPPNFLCYAHCYVVLHDSECMKIVVD